MPDIHFDCPKCGQTIDAPQEMATQLTDCPTCKETIEVPLRSQPSSSWQTGYAAKSAEYAGKSSPPTEPATLRRTRYEHMVVVLQFDRKAFAMTRDGLLQGLTGDSLAQLNMLGDDGWELISVLPYTSGRTDISIFSHRTETDAAMGFLKRIKL
jgi:hypothetical protein